MLLTVDECGANTDLIQIHIIFMLITNAAQRHGVCSAETTIVSIIIIIKYSAAYSTRLCTQLYVRLSSTLSLMGEPYLLAGRNVVSEHALQPKNVHFVLHQVTRFTDALLELHEQATIDLVT